MNMTFEEIEKECIRLNSSAVAHCNSILWTGRRIDSDAYDEIIQHEVESCGSNVEWIANYCIGVIGRHRDNPIAEGDYFTPNENDEKRGLETLQATIENSIHYFLPLFLYACEYWRLLPSIFPPYALTEELIGNATYEDAIFSLFQGSVQLRYLHIRECIIQEELYGNIEFKHQDFSNVVVEKFRNIDLTEEE
jgi:hypothetical protein